MSSHYLTVSQQISLRPLLNSMIRDFSNTGAISISNQVLEIKGIERSIKIPLTFQSLIGFHSYSRELEYSFSEIVKFITEVFEGDMSFEQQVLSSSIEMERLTKFKPNTISTYLESEQSLLKGHPFHPFPKLKGNISDNEITQFSPEYKRGFHLKWMKADSDSLELCENGIDLKLNDLREFDLNSSEEGDWIPMHPLQEKLISHLGEKVIEGRNKWFACSSMRTLYCEAAPCFLKFSLPVKLTNSVRILSGDDLKRAQVINQVFEGNHLSSFFERNPQFSIQLESTFGGLKVNEKILDESIFQLRSPLKGKSDSTYLLASLCEDHRLRERVLASDRDTSLTEIYRLKFWFSEFLDRAISPILDLAFKEGVLLGAHLQNLIVELDKGRVVGCEYRDCQGTGLTREGKERLKALVDKDALVIDHDDINKVFGYYLVVNSIFSVIAALAKESQEDEIILLNELRAFFLKQKKILSAGEFFFDYWINSKSIYQKGNFRCTIASNNENTMANPWAIYNEIENPLSLLRPLKKYGFDTLYERVNSRNGKKLSLRKLDLEKDLDIFHHWHNKEFVSEFWELNRSKEELREYIEGLYESHFQLPVIVELEDRPIGYFEIYRAFDDRIAPYAEPKVYDRGVHILIGEEKILRTRHVFDALALLTEFCFKDDEKTENLWAEPRSDNKPIIKFALGLPGWEVKHEFDFPHKRARLLQCSRSKHEEESRS